MGRTLTPEDLSQRYGMPTENVKKIQQVCNDLGVIVDVRPTTPYAEPMLRNGTALPKPEKLKAKTISEIDVMIGLGSEKDLGKVGFFDPKQVEPRRPANFEELEPKLKEEIDKRIKQRKEEFADYADDMHKLRDQGLIRINPDGTVVNTGLIKGGELPFTGDHDVFDIRAKDGSALSPADYQKAKQALIDANAGVMHGAVTGWEIDSPKTFHTDAGQKSYGKMVGDHSPGGKEPLIRFGEGDPTATWYEPARPRVDTPGGAPDVHAGAKGADGTAAPDAKAGEGSAHPDAPATAEPRAHPDEPELIDMPEGTVGMLPDAEAGSRAANQAFFDSWHAADPAREIALLRNDVTGQYVLVQGSASGVALGRENPRWAEEMLTPAQRAQGRWVYEAHAHPVDAATGATPKEMRLPSGGGKGGDLAGAAAEAGRTGKPVVEQLRYVDERGPQTMSYGVDPKAEKPYWIERPGLDGAVERREFRDLAEYESFFRGEAPSGTTFDPDAPGVGGDARAGGSTDAEGRAAKGGRKDSNAVERRRAEDIDALKRAGVLSDTVLEMDAAELRHLAELVSNSKLAEAPERRRWAENLMSDARKVIEGQRANRTVDGAPIRKGAEHVERAVAEMKSEIARLAPDASDDALTQIRRLREIQDAIARARETLRASASDFESLSDVAGDFKASDRFTGAREASLSVTAIGTVTEPLPRGLPGGDLENELLRPAQIAKLKTKPPELAQQVALAVAGTERAHLVGPGFGGELREGLMHAPRGVNQDLQNRGVEKFIRSAADWTRDVEIKVEGKGRRVELPMADGSVRHVDILDKVSYEILGPGDVTFHVEIEVGPPAKVITDIPNGAPGADELAAALNAPGS